MKHSILYYVLWVLLGVSLATIPLQTEIPASETAALLALYNATNGDIRINNSDWKGNNPEPDGFSEIGSVYTDNQTLRAFLNSKAPDWESSRTTQVTMDGAHTVTAVYESPPGTTVEGKVTDDVTGDGMLGVALTFGALQPITTSPGENYAYNNVPPGNDNVTFDHSEYKYNWR